MYHSHLVITMDFESGYAKGAHLRIFDFSYSSQRMRYYAASHTSTYINVKRRVKRRIGVEGLPMGNGVSVYPRTGQDRVEGSCMSPPWDVSFVLSIDTCNMRVFAFKPTWGEDIKNWPTFFQDAKDAGYGESPS